MDDYTRFYNSTALNRTQSPLRRIWKIQHQAGKSMISFGNGMPNPECIPFRSVVITTKDGKQIDLQGRDLHAALGYTDSLGLPELIQWLDAFQKRLHDPPYARLDSSRNQIIVTPGSQDALCKALEMLLEPGDDSVLMAEPAYPGALCAIRPMRVRMLPVAMDEDGVDPSSLRKVLEDQKTKLATDDNDRKMPKLLVIQPNHCNPSGVSTNLNRRKEIYEIACEYDLLIIEDDPYYFLTFDLDGTGSRLPPPSFLSMDTQGRVLRLESYSKVVSAGLRIGTLSGPRQLVERIMMHQDCSSMHPSTLTQTMLYRLFLDYGQDGFLEHGRSVSKFYQRRSQSMLKAARRHLKGVAEWSSPTGGMFLWMKLRGVHDSEKMISERALRKMVMLTPGNVFMCDDAKACAYVRAAYSWLTEEQMDEGFRRLAEMLKEEETNGTRKNGRWIDRG